jgi:hypothetical protein
MSRTIRISDETKARIDHLTDLTGLQVESLVARALSEFERALFFGETNRRFAELRRDKTVWQELTRERDELSGTRADRIDDGA